MDPTSGTVVQVHESIADKYLSDIFKELTKQSNDNRTRQSRIESSFNDLHSDNNKTEASQGKNNRAQQKALKGLTDSLRRGEKNRAVQNALLGNISKNTSNFKNVMKDTLKNAKEQLKSVLKDQFSKSLQNINDMAGWMRKANLTSAQKAQVNAASANIVTNASSMFDGLMISREEADDAMKAIIGDLGKNISDITAEQQVAVAALMKRGMSAQKAFEAATSSSQDTLKNMVLTMGDTTMGPMLNGMMEELGSIGAASMGGMDAAYAKIQEGAKSMQNTLGNVLDPAQSRKLAIAQLKAREGLNEQMSEDEKQLIAVFGTSAESALAAIKNNSADTARAISGDAGAMMAKAQNAIKAGTKTGTTTRTDAENKQANSINAKDGLIAQKIDDTISKLDIYFGGAISGSITKLNEVFGDGGLGIALSIAAPLLSGLKDLFKPLLGFLGKLSLPAIIAYAVYEIYKNWDKIKPILIDVVSNLATKIKDLFSGLLGSGGFLSKAVSSLSESTKGLGDKFSSSLSASTKGLGDKFGSSFSEMSSSTKKLGTSLGNLDKTTGFSESIKEAASKVDVGSVANSIVDGTSKFLSSLGPIANIIVSVVDGIAKLGVSIVTGLVELGVTLTNSIRDVIVSISPGLNAVGEAVRLIADSIKVLCDAIAPHMGQLVDCIVFITKSIFPKILDLAKLVVNNILPPILDLLKTAVQVIMPPLMDIIRYAVYTLLPPIVETFAKLVDTILPPIAAVLQTIAELFDRVVNLIIDLIEPPLRAISELITNIIELTTSIVDTVRNAVEGINDVISFTRGLFNFITAQIPDLIATLSGFINWMKDGLMPVISAGFETVQACFGLIGATIDQYIMVPLKRAWNWFCSIIQDIKIMIAKIGVTNDDKAIKAAEAEKARLQQESDQLKLDAEAATEKAKKGLNDSAEKLNKALNSDTLKNGPQKDEAKKQEVLEYLSGQKGNIAGEFNFPPNTGEMLTSITSHTEDTLSVLTNIYAAVSDLLKLPKFDDGGIATGPSLVGETRKPEAVIPLSQTSKAQAAYDGMPPIAKKLLSFVVNSDPSACTSSFVNKKDKPTAHASLKDPFSHLDELKYTDVPYSDVATAKSILGLAKTNEERHHAFFDVMARGAKGRAESYKLSQSNAGIRDGHNLIAGTPAEKALEYGVGELGKPYILRSMGKIGYVCNELTNACLKASGADLGGFYINGVKATFKNITTGRKDYPLFKVRDDLTPETALPGMLFFQDSDKTKDGSFQPGHVGLVYYGHKRLHSTGGSADYTDKGFMLGWQSNRGVVINDFDKNYKYKIGELTTLFTKPDGSKVDTSPGAIANATSGSASGSKDQKTVVPVHSDYDKMIENYSSVISAGDDYSGFLDSSPLATKLALDPDAELADSFKEDKKAIQDKLDELKSKSYTGMTAAMDAAKGGDLYGIKRATDSLFSRMSSISSDEAISKLSDIATTLKSIAMQRKASIATKPAADNFS